MLSMRAELNDFHARVEREIGLTKILHFILLLRSLGLKTREFIRKSLPQISDKNQYVSACILSYREIGNLCEDVLISSEAFLNSGKVNCKYAYVSFKRAVVLMNHPISKTHGEVRFLDPKRDILNEMLPHTRGLNKTSNSVENVLEKMKMEFHKVHGINEKYVILLFSHWIPCTEPDYMCSKLLKEYVSRSGDHMVVAFEKNYKNTDTGEAVRNMKHENIYVIDIGLVNDGIRRQENTRWAQYVIELFELAMVEEYHKLCLEQARRKRWAMKYKTPNALQWFPEKLRRQQWDARFRLQAYHLKAAIDNKFNPSDEYTRYLQTVYL